MWKKTIIPHSCGDQLYLYCLPDGKGLVSVAFCEKSENRQRQTVRETLRGSIESLTLNQYGPPIEWSNAENIFENWPCLYDARNSKDDGKQPMESIGYSVANSINLVRNLRNFNKQVKKFIFGVWKSSDATIHIEKSGSFTLEQHKSPCRLDIFPPMGTWSTGGGSLLVLNNAGNGVRMQIIDINEDKLIFGGEGTALFYEMTRQA
jgi:hypothetical protein